MNEKTTRDFIGFFVKAYPYRTGLTVVLVGIAGLLEGVGVATLIPALKLVEGDGAAGDPLSEMVVGLFGLVGMEPTLLALLGFMVVTVLLKAGAVWLAMVHWGHTVITIVSDLRLRLIGAMLEARWGYFATEQGGEWANSVGDEAQASGGAYAQACQIAASAFPIAAYLVLAWLISWPVTLLGLASGVALFLALRRFVEISRTAGRDWTAGGRRLAAFTADVMQGLKPVKAMSREFLLLPVFEGAIGKMVRANRRTMLAEQAVVFFHEPAVALIMAGAIFFVFQFTQLSLSTIVVLAFTFYRLMAHMRTAQTRYQLLVTGEAKFWSLMSRISAAEAQREVVSGDAETPALEESLTFESVSFSYGEREVIRDLSLTVSQGAFVAISGESGSGKTTLVDLIVGLHRPSKGRILVDGVDLETVDLREWRARVGYVPQEMLLLNGTIRMNVTLGDERISDQDVEEALVHSGAWGFVSELAGGLDAQVGERGAMFSGGQRQRIAIARALVTRPSLLILDEVTTALDPATEQAICDTLGELAGMVTIVSISHQEALREAADVILIMRDGVLTPGMEALGS